MSITAYRTLTWAAGPLIQRYLKRRLAAGREDATRFDERLGIASAARVYWIVEYSCPEVSKRDACFRSSHLLI